MSRIACGLRGTGSVVPDKVLTNDELSKLVDTSDEWITQRTGIKERRVVAEGESTSDLCITAARRALEDAEMAPEDIDLIVLGTVTPDQHVPATACLIQAEIGAVNAAAFDLQAGCTGFVYALSVAAQFIWSGTAKNVLVIGAECLTRITNYKDRTSCILFGDGAGAVVLSTDFRFGELCSADIAADGKGYGVMYQHAGGARVPLTHELLDDDAHKLVIRGREVYKFATNKMVELVKHEMSNNPELELGAVIPHQMSRRIIESARERLELADNRVYVNIDRFGNTSSGSIPIALDEARRTGFFDDLDGKLLVLCAFGAGLTWGSVGIKW
ncbi:MAG: beta-ketoacyl-ACP synthase III [Planctomycetota bacterium]|jgi:3-oxoacyl-[acyl-carrier-protein] synthase-3